MPVFRIRITKLTYDERPNNKKTLRAFNIVYRELFIILCGSEKKKKKRQTVISLLPYNVILL